MGGMAVRAPAAILSRDGRAARRTAVRRKRRASTLRAGRAASRAARASMRPAAACGTSAAAEPRAHSALRAHPGGSARRPCAHVPPLPPRSCRARAARVNAQSAARRAAQDECTQLATELKDSSWKSVGKATHMNGVASGLSAGTGADDGGECAPHAQLAPHAAAAERFDSLYDVGAVLGKGTYGSVRLARHRETRQVRARTPSAERPAHPPRPRPGPPRRLLVAVAARRGAAAAAVTRALARIRSFASRRVCAYTVGGHDVRSRWSHADAHAAPAVPPPRRVRAARAGVRGQDHRQALRRVFTRGPRAGDCDACRPAAPKHHSVDCRL